MRDHFRSPLNDRRSWDELHGMWPSEIVRVIRPKLPAGYIVGPNVHLGSEIEVDVGTLESDEVPAGLIGSGDGGVATATATWAPPTPTVEVDVEFPDDVYEVRIYDLHRARQLVAAVEIVSPSNKDRPGNRTKFVGKCAGMVRAGVTVCVVDVVTDRGANLYVELLDLIGRRDPTFGDAPPGVYAAAVRWLAGPPGRLEAWSRPLAVGRPLPVLPLWLTTDHAIPLDLEASYETACADLGIA